MVGRRTPVRRSWVAVSTAGEIVDGKETVEGKEIADGVATVADGEIVDGQRPRIAGRWRTAGKRQMVRRRGTMVKMETVRECEHSVCERETRRLQDVEAVACSGTDGLAWVAWES